MRKLFNKDSGTGSGNGEENITLPKAELEKLKTESDRAGKKISELENTVTSLQTEKDTLAKNYTELEGKIKNDYMEQLSDEHRKIAGLIPTIEGLKEYVKLNAAKPPAGSDSARPGAGTAELASRWDDLSYNEKEELRKKRPELWKKLYREKFGFN